LVAPSGRGMIIGTFDEDDDGVPPAGYACLYWTFSSVSATGVVLLNDLYVRPERRTAGVGQGLVADALDVPGSARVSHLR
jgi:GNAT superfamily N-acetyltransferase